MNEEDDFDIDSALDAWADSFEAGVSEPPAAPDAAAKAADDEPLRESSPTPPVGSRPPLYQPDPELKKRASERPTSPPSGSPTQLASEFPIFDDDDDDISTQIANVPQDLLRRLSPQSTDPVDIDALFPPAIPQPSNPPPQDDLDVDVDALLFELGDSVPPAEEASAIGDDDDFDLVFGEAEEAPTTNEASEGSGTSTVSAPVVTAQEPAEATPSSAPTRSFVPPPLHLGQSRRSNAPAEESSAEEVALPVQPGPPAIRPPALLNTEDAQSLGTADTIAPPEGLLLPGEDEAENAFASSPPSSVDDISADDGVLLLDDSEPPDTPASNAPAPERVAPVAAMPNEGSALPLSSEEKDSEAGAPSLVAEDAATQDTSTGDDEPSLAFADVEPALAIGDADDEPSLEFGDVEPALAIGDADDEPSLEFGDDEPALAIGDADDEPSLEFGDDEPALAIGDADDEPSLEFGDDEPALEIGDDDEPSLEFGDDDEPALEIGDTDDEPSLDFADSEASIDIGGAEDDALLDAMSAPTGDRGASAAKRTVTRRKPRREHYPLVGHGAEAQRARAALLTRLAEEVEGPSRAGLLLAAAELQMQLGRGEEARALTLSAYESDPSDLVALRNLRRDAIARGDWSEACNYLEEELRLPISDVDRAAAALLLAELRMAQLSDFGGAFDAAKTAFEATASPSAALLMAEIARADANEGALLSALQSATEGWEDATLTGLVRSYLSRNHERQERSEEAHQATDESLTGWMARARNATSDRTAALNQLAEQTTAPLLKELAQRTAAVSALAAGDAAAALTLLPEPTRPSGLRTRARAAQSAANQDARRQSLEALSASTGGEERALALVDLAEVYAAEGRLDDADAALKDAYLAEPQLATVQVVREVIARRAGDTTRLAQATLERSTSGRGAIEAAAKLVRREESNRLAQEQSQLEHALEEATAPLTADTLLLDLMAEKGDAEGVVRQLRRYADRATGGRRVGALLTLAERSEDPSAPLSEASDSAPGAADVTRPLARLLRQSDPERAATAWLEEADGAEGSRAAHAATHAARLLLDAGQTEDALQAARRAFDVDGGPGAAAWLLCGDLGPGLEGDDLGFFLEELGDADANARRGAIAHATAALRTGTGTGWGRAFELAGDDPIAREEMLASADVDSRARAKALAALTETGAPAARRMAALRAGSLYEASGDASEASRIYRALLEGGEDTLTLRFLDRADLASGAYARVAERRFARVRETAGSERALAALESLAAIDLYEKGDPRSAFLTLQSILEEAPGHLPTLRAIERYFLDQQRDDELVRILGALSKSLGPKTDAAATLRAATETLLSQADSGGAADEMLKELAPRLIEGEDPATLGPDQRWLARRLLAIPDLAPGTRATMVDAAAALRSPGEQGAVYWSEAEALQQQLAPADFAERLAPAEAGGHILLSRARASLLDATDDATGAAEAYERAASLAHADGLRLSLFHSAANAWKRAENTPAEVLALEAAASIDVAHSDVFDRLQRHYESQSANEKLADLAAKRVAAGADERTLLSLHETQARLQVSLGDREGAKKALREALKLEPSRADALEQLARLCLEDKDWTGAAEALVRFARLRQSREELRWVFFELGTIYDLHLPDPKRAEAAYRRVLKLSSGDLETLDRLATFYVREGMWPKAIMALKELQRREIDPDAKVAHTIRLSRAFEESGDLRQAEQALEQQRRSDPFDLQVLRAQADLYSRQNAQSALSMHQSRAMADFRRRIEETPADGEGWHGLAEVLSWRGMADAGRVVASAAGALGVEDVSLAQRLGVSAVGGGKRGASDVSLHESLAPSLLTPATFEVFRQAGESLEKLLPFDPRAWRARKLDKRDEGLRQEALEIAGWFGFDSVQVLIADAAPRICVPASTAPLTLVLGRDIATQASKEERAFLFARAAKVASTGLGVAMRSPPRQLGLYLSALIRLYDSGHEPPGVDARELDSAGKKMSRVLPRRIRDELGAVVVEMGGTMGFDAERLGLAAAQLGDRIALLALGDVPAAVQSLLRLASVNGGTSAAERIAAVVKVPEALDLIRFATSDLHFDARRRIGLQ